MELHRPSRAGTLSSLSQNGRCPLAQLFRPRIARLIAASLGLLLLTACARQDAGALASRIRVLDVTPPDSEGRRVQLTLDHSGPAPLAIQLRGPRQARDSKALAWGTADEPVESETVGADGGGGAPFASRPGVRLWTTGREEQQVATAIRPVRFGGETSILVYQRAGFDHLKQRHALYLIRRSDLQLGWEYEEGVGPQWSWVDMAADGRLILLVGRWAQDDRLPDEVTVHGYRRDSAAGKTVVSAPPPPLPAVILGGFPTPGAAQLRRAQSLVPGLDRAWVLPADRVENAPAQPYLLVIVTLDEAAARQAAEVAAAAGYSPFIDRLQP